jgi:hypothetical protein
MTEILDRRVYYSMKDRRISTLDLHSALEKVGVDIPKRTLQYHLDNDFRTTTDERLKYVATYMIRNYDNLIEELKNKVEKHGA